MENPAEKSFLLPVNFEVAAGLSHQQSNLKALLRYAKYRQATLVLPEFHLAAHHNAGRALVSTLEEYYDFDGLKVDREPYPVVSFSKFQDSKIPEERIIQLDCSSKRLIRELPEVAETDDIYLILPYSQSVIKEAEEVIESLLDQAFACVHVRRTDRITSDEFERDTSCSRIADVLQKVWPRGPVYVMTDEDPGFFSDLKALPHYEVLFFNDSSRLVETKANDNYRLFCVENVIMQHAAIRISTFRTGRDFFHGWLHDAPGWQ